MKINVRAVHFHRNANIPKCGICDYYKGDKEVQNYGVCVAPYTEERRNEGNVTRVYAKHRACECGKRFGRSFNDGKPSPRAYK